MKLPQRICHAGAGTAWFIAAAQSVRHGDQPWLCLGYAMLAILLGLVYHLFD